jgi:hypothetical protein
MTLASHRPTPSRSNGSVDAPPVSDFHLVEDADGWRLTINATSRLRDLLCGAAEDGSPDGSPDGGSADAAAQPFTVHVEPNLLPGQPFPVTIQPVPIQPVTIQPVPTQPRADDD